MAYNPQNPNGSATSANSAPVVIASDQAAVSVSGPLTDTQLRATAVPVSGTFYQATQPVSGTFWQTTQPVSIAASVAVTGPLTDTQLRATAVPISGTVTANAGTGTMNVTVVSGATGGDSVSNLSSQAIVSAASNNPISIKASAGKVTGWYIYNSNALARKVAFHNTAGTPTAGSAVYLSIVIPGLSATNVSFPDGIDFSTGIAITTTTGLPNNDTAIVGLNDLIINIFYK